MAVAGTIKKLLVVLGVDSAEYEKKLTKAEKRAKKFDLVLKGVFAGIALAAAKFAIESTKLAARVETLDVVVNQLGKTAGYTASELDAHEKSIRSQGITTQNTLQSMAQMVQANIDLAEGSNLARIAQDNAVIANINSSEAFRRLVTVLQTGNVLMGRTMGLNLDFAGAQKALADDLGKTTAQLSKQEIMQSRLNEVKRAGVAIEGAYDAAMGTAGKTMLSLDRQIEEISLAFGKELLPVLESAVGWLYEFTKAINLAREASEIEVEERWNSIDALEVYISNIDQVPHRLRGIALAAAETRLEELKMADAMVAFTGYGLVLDNVAISAGGAAEKMRDIALAFGEVTQAVLAKEALDAINEAWETGLVSEEDYKTMYGDIATNIAGLEDPAIAAHLKLFDINQDLATGIIDAHGYAQEVMDLGIEIGALPDYKQIKIDLLITRLEEMGIGGQYGLSMTVPPGFPNDSFPIMATSGEHVEITTPGGRGGDNQRQDNRSLLEGANIVINTPVSQEIVNDWIEEFLRG